MGPIPGDRPAGSHTMSSLVSRAPSSPIPDPPPSTISYEQPPVPLPQSRPYNEQNPRPLIVGPHEGPQSPFPVNISGIVEHGFGRGSRDLGCPTANLPASLSNHPGLQSNGVYFGWASVWLPSISSNPIIKPMVMSVGYNPVYVNKSRTVEVHVIHEFGLDFYGELVKVVVAGFIRPEFNYSSQEALIKDIEFDKKVALESLKRPNYQVLSQLSFLLTKAE